MGMCFFCIFKSVIVTPHGFCHAARFLSCRTDFVMPHGAERRCGISEDRAKKMPHQVRHDSAVTAR
jgi:hypothetical protein